MRQRTKLAQALVHDPLVLFLDEPLTGTDPVARRDLMDVIRRLGDEGRSVLVSSHVLHEVQALTPQIVLLNHGRLVAEGDVRQIRDLIDKHPHRIVLSAPASGPGGQARAAGTTSMASSCRRDDGAILVETRSPDAFYGRLPGLSLEGGHAHPRGLLRRRQPGSRLQVPGELMSVRPSRLRWPAGPALAAGRSIGGRRAVRDDGRAARPRQAAGRAGVRLCVADRLRAARPAGYNPQYDPEDAELALIFGLIPQAILPLTALVFASGMIQDEVEEQTLTYLLIRPLPRPFSLRDEARRDLVRHGRADGRLRRRGVRCRLRGAT